MIKLKKNGFSIAELLLVLAIISIVSIFGLKIAERGMEKAYDRYIYTGYKSLLDAVFTAASYGDELPPAGETGTTVSIFPSDGSMNPFIKSLALILTNDNLAKIDTNLNSGIKINTQNKISYFIDKDMQIDTNRRRRLKITMTVPKKRTIIGNNNIQDHEDFEFMYYPEELDENNQGIVNFSIPVLATGSLKSRKDLLPFFNDDGEINRVIQPQAGDDEEEDEEVDEETGGDSIEAGNTIYTGDPEYISMEQAFCEAYGTVYFQGQKIYECGSIQRRQGVTPTLAKPSHMF